MSAADKAPVSGEELAALKAEERARGRGLRLGDRFDALLVRELQQALSGRIFPVMLVLSLLAMLLLVVGVLGDTHGMLTRGADAFTAVLTVLSMLVCGVVPLQAFFATRQEAVGESAESLLLTRLSPWAIVRGKLTATNAYMLLWVSLAAPLVALTWLLRGVSVPQVLLGLLIVMLGSTVISALAVAVGTLARFERMSSLVNLLGLGGILSAAFAWTALMNAWVSGSFLRLGGEGIAVLLGIALPTLVFAILVARSQFTHPFENRSTHFRVLLPVALILAFAVMAPFVADDGPYLAALLMVAVALAGFLIFAATEEDGLSPWLALRVPKLPLRAGLAAPLLPGGARGLLWGLCMSALLVAGIAVTELRTGDRYGVFGPAPPSTYGSGSARVVVLICLYALFYGALGSLVRPKLRAGTAGNWIARGFVLGLIVVLSVVPMLLQLLLASTLDWTPLQVFNPFWTIDEASESSLAQSPAFSIIAALTLLLLLKRLPRLIHGVTDIVAAGAARRTREG